MPFKKLNLANIISRTFTPAIESLLEKALIYRDPSSYVVGIKGSNVIDFGGTVPAGDTVNNTDISKYAILIYRDYNYSPEIELFSEDTPTAAQTKALSLIENSKNNVSSVYITEFTGNAFSGYNLYKAFESYMYVSKDDVKDGDKVIEKIEGGVVKFLNSADDAIINNNDTEEFKIPTSTGSEKPTSLDLLFKAYNLEKGLVYGIVYSPNTVDSHGDWTSPEEIEKAAHDFLINSKLDDSGWTDIDHNKSDVPQGAYVVESYIAPVDFVLSNGERVKKGSWILVSRIDDEDLKKNIINGNITGFSLEGTAVKL